MRLERATVGACQVSTVKAMTSATTGEQRPAPTLVLGLVGVLVVASVTRNGHVIRVAMGIVALYIGGEATGRRRYNPVIRGLLAVPGALLVTFNAFPYLLQRWSAQLLSLVVVLAVVAAPAVRQLAPASGAYWLMVLMSIGGIYACVPETGHLQSLVLAVVALGLAEVVTGVRWGPGVTSVGVGMLGWAVVYGGTFRDSAVVGGAASFGLLALAPVVVLCSGRQRLSDGHVTSDRWRTPAMVMLQAATALIVGRTGGLADSAHTAWVQVLPALAATAVITVLAMRMLNRSEAERPAPVSVGKLP